MNLSIGRNYARQHPGLPGIEPIELRLEEEDPEETERIERLKKEQKERETILAEQRRKAREHRQEITET
jgi:hypothetical protein